MKKGKHPRRLGRGLVVGQKRNIKHTEDKEEERDEY